MFVSGIGCSSRFPTTSTPTACTRSTAARRPSRPAWPLAREDLSVWVVTGDGDALSIGGNHLIHALRRNVNMTILLFNNRIYGLTKGSTPHQRGRKITKSTPMGSVDHPFNPVSLALGAEGPFVARTIDSDRKHLTSVLRRAAAHRGTAFVEIYQNCPIFNDGAFDAIKDNDTKADAIIPLVHGEPITFGNGSKGPGPRHRHRRVKIVEVGTGHGQVDPPRCWSTTPTTPTRPPRSPSPGSPTPATSTSRRSGSSRQVERPAYDDLARAQVATAREAAAGDDAERLAAPHRRRRHLDGGLTRPVGSPGRQGIPARERGPVAVHPSREEALPVRRTIPVPVDRQTPH